MSAGAMAGEAAILLVVGTGIGVYVGRTRPESVRRLIWMFRGARSGDWYFSSDGEWYFGPAWRRHCRARLVSADGSARARCRRLRHHRGSHDSGEIAWGGNR